MSTNKQQDENLKNNYYSVTIGDITLQLPIFEISDGLSIALFDTFSHTQAVCSFASDLLAKLPSFDYLICPEAKAIPLCFELSRQSGKDYFVARKGTKVYMKKTICVEVTSITTNAVQKLYLAETDCELLRGKRIVVVDDVISTGATLTAIETMLQQIGATVVAKCAIFAEGDAAYRTDIITLGHLPLL